MTLFREINSLLFALFLLVMTSLVYFQFTQTRDFMSQQMQSDLNNTITSLGLMLQPQIETGDVATAETLVNVIFEGGFYRKVTLKWLVDGKEQVWENPVVIKGVPQWFINLDLFETQKKESLITSGWMQLATLEVEGHPALGYQELWRVMNDTVMILSFLFILSIIVLRFKLNRILKPLHNVAIHAKNISQRKFDQDIELPKTTELKDVVGAINLMSGQLKQIFSTLDDEVNDLKEDKLIDQVSQLPNRQYLSAQINNWLNEPGFGGLILAKFDWLDDIHSKYGYQGRDEIIKVVSKRMQAELPDIAESVIARIANTEFAFLITKAEKSTIKVYLQTLIRLINQEITKAGCSPNTRFALGVSQRIENMNSADLLSQSDNALQQAQRDNKVSHWIDADQPQKYSREQWRSKLVDSINNNHFIFQWQPILSTRTKKVIQREIYCRLNIDEQIVTASEFMPFIELLSLGSQLDRCLLQSIEQQNILAQSSEGVAINLTHDTLQDPQFIQWLTQYLKQSIYADRILFEIPESAAISSLNQCYQLAEIIKAAGAKIGIDQCGRQIGSLEYLQKLRPNYIKLDLSFAYYEKLNQNKELCRALVNVAKGLGIAVIITGIEDQEQLAAFNSLKAEGYQGYISPVEDVDINHS
ncbi:bifunctional diguanylate cyclase/phosphodiesterase [Colwellia hornerae]|uniref:EAL domain-containing protein n=1 Tax=Colwellia hornerae TaxID=89402 RepID=A0A5C6Q802_9GAMM|nr:EAL domain-containing protein [Colwellia hornerae]TWX52200.1 EAL domain-containing protein [Colwellia hornerae]TWX57549.1 EAL domain-containing protein [Colwellia hornerae]TWX64901.1 EAL domain-containing protein [Colwellia hornerae]